MKYIAQPYWTEGVVRIYALPAMTLVTTVTLAHGGPNDVLIFSDPPAGKAYMFVSYDPGAGGAIDIYNLGAINLALSANTPPATTLVLANSVVGMAVQPGTADLYVATFSGPGTPGGVFSYTHSSGYAAASLLQFSSYADAYNDVAQYCANLAFDPHGKLWMTTFQDGAPGNQFLICYAQVDRTAGSSAKFFKIGNATANLSAVTLPGSATPAAGTFYPLSQPEGLAFDPLGNLWLANNSDDFNTNGFAGNGEVNGTLLRLDRSWIDQHLLTNAGILGVLTPDGYGGTQHIGAADPGVTLYYLNGGRFGGLLFDGFTLYVNDQSPSNANPGHTVVWRFQTDQPLPPATFAPSGITTTYPGNGQMAVFNSTPSSLLIRDTAGDVGAEPDGVAVMWESPDIAVTNTSILATLPGPNASRASDVVDLSSDGTITGTSAFVYVRVTNIGAVSTTGTEVLKLYWAKASAGLDWPAPWDGLTFDVTASKPPMGGLIGARTLGAIDPGNETVFEFPWASLPDSSLYTVDDQHFCLLARVELGGLYPFGMTYPEEVNGVAESAVAYNTVSNSKIGWRNVTIIPPAKDVIHPVAIRLGVLGANHAPRERVMHFAVQTLNRHGLPAYLPGTVMLHAAGRTRERLMEPTAEGHARQHAGDGRFHLHDLAIRLAANEVLPFHVEFLPAEQVTDFAVRVVQYVETRRGPRLVGGQTFVVGKVRGFAVR
jgi:hypothetical protein